MKTMIPNKSLKNLGTHLKLLFSNYTLQNSKKHNYERELTDMLQYQIESTIYEAKSKLLQKERSPEFSNKSHEPELEMPLEVTYSENEVYPKFTPKNDTFYASNGVNLTHEIEKNNEDVTGSEYYYDNGKCRLVTYNAINAI